MAFTKPNVNQLWASSGSIVAPSLAKQQQGWVSEIPDYEFENWLQNKQDQYIAHSNQYGIPVWDSVTEYIANRSYVQDSNGIVYRAIQTHTNQNPETDTNNTYWVTAFSTFEVAYTKAESDNLFMKRGNNLSDVSSIANARNNLSVYSKSEVYTKTEVNNLLDPIGKVIMFGGNSEPSGYLFCDGRALSRTVYADLFSVIGTNFGNGNGSTTFNIPNLEDEFVRGASPSRSVGSKQSDQLGSHRHTGNTNSTQNHEHELPTSSGTAGNVWGIRDDVWVQSAGNAVPVPGAIAKTYPSGSHNHPFTTNYSGGDETRPRNVALRFCIKY